MARIACVQVSLVPDAAANLAHCLALIDEAATVHPDLIVLPEMSHWSGGLVKSRADALEHGTTVPGPFTDAVAGRAIRHRCHVAIGLIERLDDEAFITSVVIDPTGAIVLKVQKQVLFAGQRLWASVGRCGNPVVSLPFARIGVYICADGLVPETTRVLALGGAQLLLNTLHSGGQDETWLHVPARAVENRVWVASANKVGPRDLGGLGQFCGGSQIVSPDGEVLARADDHTPGFIWADIDPGLADDKQLAGEDLMDLRRPDCYGLLTRALTASPLGTDADAAPPTGPASLAVATLQPRGLGDAAIDSVLSQWRAAAARGAALVLTPSLFAHDLSSLSTTAAVQAARVPAWLERLGACARQTATWGAVSLLEAEGDRIFPTVWLLDARGQVHARHRQVHLPRAWRSWARAGDDLTVHQTAIGRIGLLADADALVPEASRVLARQGAELIAIAGRWHSPLEADLLLPERAAENRVHLALAARTDSAVARGSVIVPVLPWPSEPHWKVRSPDLIEAAPAAPFLLHGLDLVATRDKTVAPQGCDLFASSLPAAYGSLTRPSPERS